MTKKIEKIVAELEGKLTIDNIINSRYNEQNFHMQKEALLHEKGLDKNRRKKRN